MGPRGGGLLAGDVFVAVLVQGWPAPQVNRRTLIPVVVGSVAALDAAPAFTDEISDATR